MTPLGEWLSKFVPVKIWLILRTIKNLLNAGSQGTGAYSKEDGPVVSGGSFKPPQEFLGGLKGSLVKNEVEGILEKASAEPETGMSHFQAATWTAFCTIATAAVAAVDWSKLFSAPKEFIVGLFAAFLYAWSVYLSTPGRTKVDIGSNRKIAETAKTYSSVKVEVPLPPPDVK